MYRQLYFLDKTILLDVRWQGTCLASRTLLGMFGLNICADFAFTSSLNSMFDFMPF